MIRRSSRCLLQSAHKQRTSTGSIPVTYNATHNCRLDVIASTIKRNSQSLAAIAGTQNSDKHDYFSMNWMKTVAAMTATAGALAVSGNSMMNESKTDCCGIVGVVGTTDHDAR